MSGLYVGRTLTPESEERLRRWWSSFDTGFELDVNPHVTVAHSSIRPKGFVPQTELVSAVPLRLGILGEDRAVVVFLESTELQRRWRELLESGATWDYASYQPHLTLFYLTEEESLGSELMDLDWAAAPVPPFNFEFGPEQFGPLSRDVFAKLAVAAARLRGEARKWVNLGPGVGPQIRGLFAKYNQNHDEKGRFASGPGVSSSGQKVFRVASAASAPPQVAKRLKELRIPPGWRNIELAMDPKAKVLAKGIDAKGRVVSKRSAAAAEEAAAEKFSRLKQFNKVRPKIVEAAEADLKSQDPATRANATLLLLLDRTGFRPGSDRDTKATVKAYGATTLESQHVKVKGNTIQFEFVGKKGVTIRKTLVDSQLAPELAQRVKRGGKLFPETSDSKMRAYLKSKGGAKFKLKDFRTWNGTAEAARKVKELPVPKTPAEFKRLQHQVAKHVSSVLGNTPAIALKAYIDPAVFARWDKVA